jgi:hypothetical protein
LFTSQSFGRVLPCLTDSGLGGGDNGVKGSGVGNSKVAEDFAIEQYLCLFQTVDELAIPDAALAAGGVQPDNPQAPKVAFALLSSEAGIDAGPDERLLGQPVIMSRRAAVSPDGLQNSFSCPASCSAFSYSWHISFPSKMCLGLLAAS